MCRHRFATAPCDSRVSLGESRICLPYQHLDLIQKGWWQRISTLRIMDLTETQISSLDCPAHRGCMGFRRQTSTGATDVFLAETTFFMPALCWRTRTIVLSIWTYLWSASAAWTSKNFARDYTHSSTFEECVLSKSRQSLWACSAKGYRPENGRAPLIRVGIILGSSSDVSNTVGWQVFYALPLIIMKSLVSSSLWNVPQ